MKRFACAALLAGALTLAAPHTAVAQDAPQLLSAGEMAPDIEFHGATRHGVLQEPSRLSDYRGETVVLAFFFRARTRG